MPVMGSVAALIPSAISLAFAGYFSFTDRAYLLRGCRKEDYPEVIFLFIILPMALLALGAGLRSILDTRHSTRRRYSPLAISLLLSVLCIGITIAVLIEPGKGGCTAE